MSLTVLTGPMFSGKSSTLVRYVDRARVIGHKTAILSPVTDTRAESQMICHTGERRDVVKISDLAVFITDDRFRDAQTIGIDEAQFFDTCDLFEFCRAAADIHGKDVIVAGLDTDFQRRPFGGVTRLASIADKYVKLDALCSVCSDGTPAIFTARKTQARSVSTIVVGGQDMYQAVCRRHYLESVGA